MNYEFKFLGQGSYNVAYLVIEQTTGRRLGVFKFPITPMPTDPAIDEQLYLDASLDTVERSIKIWNEINPSMPARKFSGRINGRTYNGWLSPFIVGRQAYDVEIVSILIDIYKRTGRVIVDAVGARNVLTQIDGSPICIDIGFALKLDAVYGPLPRIRDRKRHGDRPDFAGVAQWRTLQLSNFEHYYDDYKALRPFSINVIKALLFLNRHKPNLRTVDFLFHQYIAEKLSEAYVQELFKPEQFDGGKAVFNWLKETTVLELRETPHRDAKVSRGQIGLFWRPIPFSSGAVKGHEASSFTESIPSLMQQKLT
ncbi:hypothetical protein [Legionella sp. km772]|uniref:hypothetical protein n=1 Tax=Legionella sp. km772 TaxID=2498111 RepID=UPI000F8E9E33|nr:hypothetical protein [Legionella sp. km772]RUR05836.1 hypothetical protein ELY15_13855 [Legionella sp. km772]